MPWKKTETGVVHFVSTESGPWPDVVARETSLSSEFLLELAALGSVYLNNYRIFESAEIKADDYLRLHTDPRRYSLISLTDRLVFENEDLVVLDKPAGLPCHPTVDNAQENLLISLQQQLNRELFLTHRLDVPTSGLLVFAKNPQAQAYFHELLKDRRVQKFYEAEVAWPGPDLGLHEHHMVKSRYAPKIMHAAPTGETQICQLRILEKHRAPRSSLKKVDSLVDSKADSAIFSKDADIVKIDSAILRIELLTGRTHQIRAQLGFMGFPILGDEQYRTLSDKKPDFEKFPLRCVELNFPWKNDLLKLKVKGLLSLEIPN